jgi:hypothetical protein
MLSDLVGSVSQGVVVPSYDTPWHYLKLRMRNEKERQSAAVGVLRTRYEDLARAASKLLEG